MQGEPSLAMIASACRFAMKDLCARNIVGWAMSERIDTRLVIDALDLAIARQRASTGSHGPRRQTEPASMQVLTFESSLPNTGCSRACHGAVIAMTTHRWKAFSRV